MTRTTAAKPNPRRNLELLEWLAGGALRPDAPAEPAPRDDASEKAFRRLHADARYRSRLWL